MAVKKNLPQISIPKSNDINGKNSSNMPKSNEIEKKENENEKKDSDIMILKKTEFIPDLKKYKKLGFLGQGSSGIVEKAIYEPSNTLLALKSIPLNSDETFKKQLTTELATLSNCHSEFIVDCYSAFYEKGLITIAMEYMDIGTLTTVLKSVGKLDETILGLITYQVLKGLDYLHKKLKVIHRDIKPSNLLINSKGQIKIADFGVSGKMVHTNDSKNSWVGTLMYMSPERFKGEHYNSNTDIWSLGLTVMECALGFYPYNHKITFWDLLDAINSKPIPILESNFSDDLKDFVSKCLIKDPKLRANTTELLSHNFVKDYEKMPLDFFIEWLKYIK